MSESPVLLNGDGDQPDEVISLCAMCQYAIGLNSADFCPNCGAKLIKKCPECFVPLNYCYRCGNRIYSLTELLRQEIFVRHRFLAFAGVSVLGIVVLSKLWAGFWRATSRPRQIRLESAAFDPPSDVWTSALNLTSWCVSWIPKFPK